MYSIQVIHSIENKLFWVVSVFYVSVGADMNTFFCFSTEKWYELPSFPNPNKWGYSMVSLNNDVYITGGSQSFRKIEKDTMTKF